MARIYLSPSDTACVCYNPSSLTTLGADRLCDLDASTLPAASAAAALAQLHGHRGDQEWDSEGVRARGAVASTN
jgi:hypothetical protein